MPRHEPIITIDIQGKSHWWYIDDSGDYVLISEDGLVGWVSPGWFLYWVWLYKAEIGPRPTLNPLRARLLVEKHVVKDQPGTKHDRAFLAALKSRFTKREEKPIERS